jgi:hypothetical protein
MTVLYVAIALLFIVNVFQFVWYNYSNRLPFVVVPDEAAALRIAESVLVSVYGDGVFVTKPFKVTYHDSDKTWHIIGSLPRNSVGGVPEIIIRKTDAKVMFIHHGM